MTLENSGYVKRQSSKLSVGGISQEVGSILSYKSYIRDDPPTGYQNLPVAILLKIFSYFSERDLSIRIAPVCQKWRRVVLLPVNWTTLTFKGNNVPQSYIFQQLRNAPYLQRISLYGIKDVAPIIRQICRCNKSLRSVVIKNCSGKDFNENVLRNLLVSCTYLEHIDLKGTSFTGTYFYVELGNLPNLRSINLTKNEYLDRKNLVELALNMPTLLELKVSYWDPDKDLTHSDMRLIFKNLRATLQSLTFDGMTLTDSCYDSILRCHKLTKLKLLNATKMSPTSFVNIWKKLPNIKKLKINNSWIDSHFYEILFADGRNVMSALVTLDFSGNILDDAALDIIAACCKNLRKLNLKGCKRITTIDPVIGHCKHMTVLNLAFCYKVTADLTNIPMELNHLQKVFHHNRDVLKKLKDSWPYLKAVLLKNEVSKYSELIH